MNAAQLMLVLAVKLYRWLVSPALSFVLGPLARCRFTPSCSAYALEAVQRHGALAGAGLALRRLGRCHPWGGCGVDPVPPPGAPKLPLHEPEGRRPRRPAWGNPRTSNGGEDASAPVLGSPH